MDKFDFFLCNFIIESAPSLLFKALPNMRKIGSDKSEIISVFRTQRSQDSIEFSSGPYLSNYRERFSQSVH